MKDNGTHVADVRWEGVLEDNDGYARLLEIYANQGLCPTVGVCPTGNAPA